MFVQTQDFSYELNPLTFKMCLLPYLEEVSIPKAAEMVTLVVATVISLRQSSQQCLSC